MPYTIDCEQQAPPLAAVERLKCVGSQEKRCEEEVVLLGDLSTRDTGPPLYSTTIEMPAAPREKGPSSIE